MLPMMTMMMMIAALDFFLALLQAFMLFKLKHSRYIVSPEIASNQIVPKSNC